MMTPNHIHRDTLQVLFKSGIPDSAIRAYVFLAGQADPNTGIATPTREELAQAIGRSTKTVARALKDLEEIGQIDIIRRRDKNGTYRPSVYALDPTAIQRPRHASAAPLTEDNSFVCDKCGIRRVGDALAEIDHGETELYTCISCDRPQQPGNMTDRWHNAIALANTYGDNQAAEALMSTMSRNELRHMSSALVGLLFARTDIRPEIEDTFEWLQAFRQHFEDWFDRSGRPG